MLSHIENSNKVFRKLRFKYIKKMFEIVMFEGEDIQKKFIGRENLLFVKVKILIPIKSLIILSELVMLVNLKSL